MITLRRAILGLVLSLIWVAVSSCDAFWAAAPAALSTVSTIAQAIARDRGQPLNIHETDALEVALRELSAARKALDEAEANADERCRVEPSARPAGEPVTPRAVVPRARRKARAHADVAASEAKLAEVIARLARIEGALDAGAD